jgi:Ca2+-binding RTX toxin-like protein
MFGGSGAATLIGGGSNDFLQGGTGAASLVAGAGAETLAAGAGNATLEAHAAGLDAFDFATHGAGGSYVIQSFATTDDLYFANAATATAATSLYHVAGGSGTITLTDSTRIVLVGFTGSITGSVTHG